MDRLKSHLQHGNLMGALKGMAKFRGMKMSDRMLKKTLIKSGDVTLKKAAYNPSATKQKSISVVRKYAEQIDKDKNLEFTYEAKRENLDKSNIAARHLIEKAFNKQLLAAKPKGPSKDDIENAKRREKAKEMLHKYERAKERREIDKKEHPEQFEKKPSTIAEVMKAKQQKAAAASGGAPARPVNTSLPQISGTTIHTVQTGPANPDDALQVAAAPTEENSGIQPQEPMPAQEPDQTPLADGENGTQPTPTDKKDDTNEEKEEPVVDMDIG